MQIEPATCPACGATYDPLRARAVTVIDGRVRAFCSVACRDRGAAPPPPHRPVLDAHAPIQPPSSGWRYLGAENMVLVAAAVVVLSVFVVLLVVGRRKRGATPPIGSLGSIASTSTRPASARSALGGGDSSDEPDVWIQPLASAPHRKIEHNRQIFTPAREAVPAGECGGARCAVDVEGAPGEAVMAVHDGVIETVERDPDPAGQRGREGRFVRINHKGGTLASSYMQLDGIREDLRPGIPIRVGEPIGTIGRAGGAASHPHFRFAMSIRDPESRTESFMDPQPLLVVWPAHARASLSLHAMEPSPRSAE